MTKKTLWVRKQIEVNTDPQRRCYDGCFAKSELVWTEWQYLFSAGGDMEATLKNFQYINPSHQYKLTEGEERP